jgi:hypothetical protein
MKTHGKCGQFESWDRNGILEIIGKMFLTFGNKYFGP